MTEPRFYCEVLPAIGGAVTLTPEETRHVIGARRLRGGDTIWLFDGRGTVARARIADPPRRGTPVTAHVEESHVEPQPRVAHLACALPKGDRLGVLLDMAAQLGMTDFTPLSCERSIVKPGSGIRDRWVRICLAACKQSRRAYLPRLHAAASPAQASVAAQTAGHAVWLADPGGAVPRPTANGVLLLVGPEGGFTDVERNAVIAAGAQCVDLGAAILRVEAAAIALLVAAQLCGRSDG